MNLKGHRLIPAGLAALGALAGFVLRRRQLGTIFDGMGLAAGGHASTLCLGILCALVTAALALLARGLPQRERYEETFSSGLLELVVSAAAVLLLLLSCTLTLLQRPPVQMMILAFLGVLSGFLIAATAAQRFRGVVPSLAFHAVPCVYLVLHLLIHFKLWSIDPVIQDYCYKLFAGIASTCAALHLGEFCLGKGHRRITLFWCLAGTVFSAIAVADPGWDSRLLNGAMCLWCAINAWQLLED